MTQRGFAKLWALFLVLGLLLGWGGLEYTLLSQEETDADSEAEQISLLFVQTATSGTFAPDEDNPGLFVITLNNLAQNTGYFSDRPFRVAGFVSSDAFYEAIPFDDEVQFNAAFTLIDLTNDAQDVIFTVINDVQYDPEQNKAIYRVEVLNAIDNTNFNYLTLDQDEELPTVFADASVFIDSFWDDLADIFGASLVKSGLEKINDLVCTTVTITEIAAGEDVTHKEDENVFDQECDAVQEALKG